MRVDGDLDKFLEKFDPSLRNAVKKVLEKVNTELGYGARIDVDDNEVCVSNTRYYDDGLRQFHYDIAVCWKVPKRKIRTLESLQNWLYNRMRVFIGDMDKHTVEREEDKTWKELQPLFQKLGVESCDDVADRLVEAEEINEDLERASDKCAEWEELILIKDIMEYWEELIGEIIGETL